MNKRLHKLIFGTANQRQRYSIRKLTIGAASVLLGTTFLFGAGQTVQADTTGQESEPEEETVQLDENVNKDKTAKTAESVDIRDATSTDTSASDVHEQNKQVTTNNYTTQSEEAAKQETNNQEKTNNVDIKNQNSGVEPQATSATNNTDVKENGSTDSKVTKDVSTSEVNNKKAESAEEKAQHVDSTKVENKEQKTSLENKGNANEVQTEKANVSEIKSENATDKVQTQTLKVTSTTPLSAQALAESKAKKQDNVTATVNFIDDDPTYGSADTFASKTYNIESGATVSDLIKLVKSDLDKITEDYYGPDPKMDSIAPGVPVATGTYKHAPIATLDDKTREFHLDPSTLQDKPLLAGYTITTDDNDKLDLDAAITNNTTYNLNLIHRNSINQFKHFYKSYTRQITYKMYGLNDQSIAPKTVTQYARALEVQGKDYNHTNPTTNHNEIDFADTLYTWDMVTGGSSMLTNTQTSWRGLALVFDGQKSPLAKDGSEYSQLVGWIPNKNVDPTSEKPREGYSINKNVGGLFYRNRPIPAPQNETVTYYHNQPVDLSFEDISPIDPQDLSENNYEASNELTYDNTASNQYNVYDALNKSGNKLSDVIKSIEDKGYKLVSITNDDDSHTELKGNSQINLTYNKDGVWKSETGGDSAENLIHKRYTIKFEHNIAKNQTINTSTTRTVHYVADKGNGQYDPLQNPKTQTVNFTLTGSIDLVTNNYIDPSNNQQYKLTKNNDGTYTMDIADASKVSGWQTTDKFDKVQQDKITKSDGSVWVIDHASEKTANGTKLDDKFAPEVDSVSAKKYDDIYLVYNRETASYKIHYIDVNGSTKSDGFTTHDGTELTNHEISNVSGYVGESSDPTKLNLWNFTDDGYVLVDTSGNVKGADDNVDISKLGKQEFIEGMGDNNDHDQYVYLKHKAVEITSGTDKDSVPKDKNGKTHVDPSTLSKTATRTINYVSDKGATLLDKTTQSIKFEGTAYVDAVNGDLVQTTTVTDKNSGAQVTVSTGKAGSITWKATAVDDSTVKDGKASFNEVTKPVITLTTGSNVDTWTTADEAAKDTTNLDPASSDFESSREVTLTYTKDINAKIEYIDDTTGDTLSTENDSDKHGKDGQTVHFTNDPTTTISNYEDQGYVLVRNDYGTGQTYGDKDSTYEVHFVHGQVTTPTDKTPDSEKKSTTKEVKRVIKYFDAQTGDSLENLAPAKTQTVTYTRTAVYDAVNGHFLGYAKLNDGQPVKDEHDRVVVDSSLTDETSWKNDNPVYAAVDSPDLTGDGYQATMSFNKDRNDGDAAQAHKANATPDHDGDEVDIYYFHATESKTDTHNKTVTRKIYYRGTKDGGKSYDDIAGLASKSNPETQTITFTRTAIIDKVNGDVLGYDTNGDGKVDTTNADDAWVTDKDSFDKVDSPDPESLGYDDVDKATIAGQSGVKVTDKFDDPIVVTYSKKEINADITYWDITNGEDHKTQIGSPEQDSDDYGTRGDAIHFDNNAKHISNLEKEGYVLVSSDYPENAKYGKEDSHFNVYFRHAVKEITSTTPTNEVPKTSDGNPAVNPTDLHKEFDRTISYKSADGTDIKTPTDQKVDFDGTVFVDEVTGKTTTPEKITINGKKVQVATTTPGTINWTTSKDTLDAINQPTIESDTGTWYLVKGEAKEVHLTHDSDNPANVTLIYKQKANYNIHYVDINDPAEHVELTDHEITNIGENNYVGDTPDANLWTGYSDDGYVIVGLSDNAKDGKLGKQKLANGIQDQYVYLKHKAVKITSKTLDSDVPKNSDGHPSVDPNDLSKTAQRTIHYRSAADGTELLPDTTQNVKFEGTEYVDAHTGKVVQVTTATDAITGNQVTVSTGKPGSITWTVTVGDGATVGSDGKASFNGVTKSVIKKGNVKWTVTPTTANAASKFTVPDPSDKNFKKDVSVTLEYNQNADADIVYYDVTDGSPVELSHADDNDGDGIVGQKITFATMPKDQITQYEDQGYILVGNNFAPTDTYQKSGNHFEVKLVRGTTTKPTAKTPAGEKKDTTKEVKRIINYLDAQTGDKVADPTTQTVTFSRTAVYDAVNGTFLGYAKLKDGQPENDEHGKIIVDPSLTDDNSWTSKDANLPEVTSPDLTSSGYQATMSFNKDHNAGDAAEVAKHSVSAKDDNQEVNVYYFHATKATPETQEVTRKIYYRGTKNGGKTYEDIPGLANKTDPETQTITFTRTAIIDKVNGDVLGYDTNNDGKVDTTNADDAWVTDKDSFDLINVPTATSEGYDNVDQTTIPAQSGIKPTDKFTDPIVVTYSKKKVNADITYWDTTDGQVKLGTDQDSDEYGTRGDVIHFDGGKGISDLEKKGYVLVSTDYHDGDKYGKEDSHFNVYFKHAVKEITSKTPKSDVPKTSDGKTTVNPSDLHKEFSRTIYYKSADGTTLIDPTVQKTDFNGTIFVDEVTGKTTTPDQITVNGKQVQVATTTPGKTNWSKAKDTFDAIKQSTIGSGSDTWYLVSDGADKVELTPTSDNPANVTLTYKQKANYRIHYIDVNDPAKQVELTDHEISDVGEDNYVGDTPDVTKNLWSQADYEKAGYILAGVSDNAKDGKLGKQELTKNVGDQYVYLKHSTAPSTPETKEVTRTIYYRGTSDGGKTYEDVAGLATEKNPTVQTVTFTRTAIVDKVTDKIIGYDTDNDGKVDTTDGDQAWTTKNNSFGLITVPTADSENYDTVDQTTIPAQTGIKPSSKFDPVVVTYSRTLINADITYWDIANGEDHKVKIETDQDSDKFGRQGQLIHFNKDQLTKLEKQGYVFVSTDYEAGVKYGNKDSHFNVYLKHGITPSSDKTKKDEVKSETISQTRTISYRDAATGKTINEELKEYGIDAQVPDIHQTVDYIRVPLYDAFNGMFLGFAAIQMNTKGFAELDSDGKPVIEKDANNQPIIATQDENAAWVPTGEHTDYPEQASPDLSKYGFVKESSLDPDKNKENGGMVDSSPADPTQKGGLVKVYYFHEHKDVSYDDPEFKLDKKEVVKTFTRTITYRGTRDGGKTYEAVDGAPDGSHEYVQTVTFTRQAIIDAVTKKVLSYTAWKPVSAVMVEVDSKKPSEVGYDNVDIKKVDAYQVDPDHDAEDLGKIVVTYTMNSAPSDGGNTGDEPENPGNKGSTSGKSNENQPDKGKTDKPKKDETKKPEIKKPKEKKTKEKKSNKKTVQKKTVKKSTKQAKPNKQSKQAPKPAQKAVNKISNNAPRGEDMYRNNAPKSEIDNATMPKSEVAANSVKPKGMVNNATAGANGETLNAGQVGTLPQTGEKKTNAAAFGLVALAFAGLASFVGVDRKKKRN